MNNVLSADSLNTSTRKHGRGRWCCKYRPEVCKSNYSLLTKDKLSSNAWGIKPTAAS